MGYKPCHDCQAADHEKARELEASARRQERREQVASIWRCTMPVVVDENNTYHCLGDPAVFQDDFETVLRAEDSGAEEIIIGEIVGPVDDCGWVLSLRSQGLAEEMVKSGNVENPLRTQCPFLSAFQGKPQKIEQEAIRVGPKSYRGTMSRIFKDPGTGQLCKIPAGGLKSYKPCPKCVPPPPEIP
jgi:hypothetical protein